MGKKIPTPEEVKTLYETLDKAGKRRYSEAKRLTALYNKAQQRYADAYQALVRSQTVEGARYCHNNRGHNPCFSVYSAKCRVCGAEARLGDGRMACVPVYFGDTKIGMVDID